ncbi:hypothetical protein [Streptomyces antibioticus]|uniref:hypothetical protein n=1 Tax=Streptomyces antibioticus TaxID=1890 RepID=UPI0036FE23B6
MTAPTTVQWLRAAVHRIAVGSSRLTTLLAAGAVRRGLVVWRRTAGWLGEASGLAWLVRVGLLLLAAAVAREVVASVAGSAYERLASGGAPWLLWGVALWWIVAAYRAGAEGWEPKQTPPFGAAEEQPAAEAAEGTEPPAAPTPPVSPVALVAAVRDIGTPHAQLVPLAGHLRTTTDAVRAAAAGVGWPVKDVRMEGRSSSAGLRWDDCPSPTIPVPSGGVVGAGQSADDNDDTCETGPREGVRVEDIGQGGRVVRDPAEGSRYHLLRKR